MAQKCHQNYSDWNTAVHCSFDNVFTESIARTVGRNIHEILGITHFQINEMANTVPSTFIFLCQRREANLIRDKLAHITTDTYSHIWFSIQDNPFHYLHNWRSVLPNTSIKLKNYPVFYFFGSMYSYNTFISHSSQYPAIHDLCITKWKGEPEAIRVMSRDGSRQIFIPINWIQNRILVNTERRPYVVLMLKYSVIMKKKIANIGDSTYERICETGEDELDTIISKSSDIRLSFDDISHTWTFLQELIRNSKEYRTPFKIYFATLRCNPVKNQEQRFTLPPSASHKQEYALNMLYSTGYVFQDKYSKQIHDRLTTVDEKLFNEICYYLKEKLEENHCYNVQNIFDHFNVINRESCQEDQYRAKKTAYSIGSILLTPLRILYQKMVPSIGNRVLRMTEFNNEDMFLLVHIREEDNEALKYFDSSIRQRLKSKMLHGIKAMGRTYRLFGASGSQLRDMSFWFVADESRSIEDAWKLLGDLFAIKNVANFIARIGLYLTTSHQTQISFRYEKNFTSNMTNVVTMIDDIETEDKKYRFTDGIGKMSWGIAGLIAIRLDIKLETKEDIPSAYQVRIAGCKGMLVIDPKSTLNDYYIKIRPSMEKFQSNNWDLEICEYSRPLELKLNNQVIMLLSDLGNSDALFEAYQNIALTSLFAPNVNEQRRKLKYSSEAEDLLKNKIPLPLNEGRNMFGVVDETGTLEYGQVFIQYQSLDASNEKTYIVVTGEVLVAKMPCLYPGDVRKYTAVNVPELQTCIRDCIVFPIKGHRPHPNEMSGSDLDGDKYWVYWDNRLQIRQMEKPLSYEPAEKQTVGRVTKEIVIDHIVESFGTGTQGLICDVHLVMADYLPERTKSTECRYLAKLFARAVDVPKTGEMIPLDEVYKFRAKYCEEYPEFMRKYDQPIRDSTNILNKLFRKASAQFFQLRENPDQTRPYFSSKPDTLLKRPARTRDKEFEQWLELHGCSIPVSVDPQETTNEEDKSHSEVSIFIQNINVDAKWIQKGLTVAGGHDEGEAFHQLYEPYGIYVYDHQTIYICDEHNHRIVEWRIGETHGRIVAGGNGQGKRNDQLNGPLNLILDKQTDSFLICDCGNKRIVRWPRQNGTAGETIISKVSCDDLAMDKDGYLYVSDHHRQEVKRWKIGVPNGVVVAGGNGKGNKPHQLDYPTSIFVDHEQSVYVSDNHNHRVMKWKKDAKEGIVVAGGHGQGNGLRQLSCPRSIIVDQAGTIYIVDQFSHRVMRWLKDAPEGNVIVGGKFGRGEEQLNYPACISFDQENNLYIVDRHNNRIQKFNILNRTDQKNLTNGKQEVENQSESSQVSSAVDLKLPKQGKTVAGGHGQGCADNQLSSPEGLLLDDNQTMVIADAGNARIIQWNIDDDKGRVIAGGHGIGNGLNQLNVPTNMLIDKETNSLIICEWGNRRVVRWSRLRGTTEGEILVSNIQCHGIAMDHQRYLYLSDTEKHEVRRYRIGEKNGTLVAGGNGKGSGLHQLNFPTYLFVDQQQSLYVSDSSNNRVMKWDKDASEGQVVAGGHGRGYQLYQLSYPQGLFVDASGDTYVAELGNRRVTRWSKGTREGTVILGRHGDQNEANQFGQPRGFFVDQYSNFYIVDCSKHRVQGFSIN